MYMGSPLGNACKPVCFEARFFWQQNLRLTFRASFYIVCKGLFLILFHLPSSHSVAKKLRARVINVASNDI